MPQSWVLDGDCREVLATAPADSVDAIVTDPPYELTSGRNASGGFMGKAWDASGVAYGPRVWTECLRVLKPGGYLLSFGGTRTYHRMVCAIEDAGFEIRDSILSWVYGSGFPKGKNALKPAHEPIVVARKPLIGTVAENVLRYGTGGINVAACRVASSSRPVMVRTGSVVAPSSTENPTTGATSNGEMTTQGRWPPNLLLTHSPDCQDLALCVDGCPVREMDEQSGDRKSNGARVRAPGSRIYANGKVFVNTLAEVGQDVGYGDNGGASRFFPVFRYTAKAGRKERPQVEGAPQHPTVKPLALMRWLVRLVTPPGGVVLDPFAGSGATLEAATLEGFDSVGIELMPEYRPLIEERLRRSAPADDQLAFG